MKQNLIIRASAGTGKTFSLATRFIRLMLFERVDPRRIVALTFSRAAAQEIYMKLLERLWKAARDDAGAREERKTLLAGLSEAERASVNVAGTAAEFAELLRAVIGAQGHATIATLDSFILRIVRSFPLEMGFQNAVDVLDGFGEDRAVAEARASLLDSEEPNEAFVANFRMATDNAFVRTCSKALGSALAGWRDFLLTHRGTCDRWTRASVCAALGVAENPVRPDLSSFVTGKSSDLRDQFARRVEGFTPEAEVVKTSKPSKLDEMIIRLAAHPEETAYSYEDRGKSKTIDLGADGAAAFHAGVKYMMSVKLGRTIDVVLAKLALCRMVEYEYDVSTRRRGQLTFADFTDCQAVAEEDSEAALRLENLQYRFDERFSHWALDEFQDTSEVQWKCLKRLVREAAQPDAGRSVMAVGDLKQSIYTWRGGNDAPFKEMMEDWPEFRENGEIVPNDVSYRYGANTADFINRVFGEANIRGSGVLGPGCEDAVNRWLASDCWMLHRSGAANPQGDCVRVLAVKPPEKGAPEEEAPAEQDDAEETSAAMRVLAPKIVLCAEELWKAHEAAGSTETVGILVRNNADGAALAEQLRARDLPVVWEGADGVLDAPVVRAVMELLKLAEHPQDKFAWKTVHVLFPIREIVFPGLKYASGVSRAVSRMLTEAGLARTLREMVAKIVSSGFELDARSVLRLEGLVRAGVAYERRGDATGGVGRFADYLRLTAGRETSSSPHVIRILTIHRSKGLTLDRVIVPVLEKGARDSIVRPRKGTPLAGEGWALDSVPEGLAKLNPKLATAWREVANARVLEQLRLNYVALTRARKETVVFVCDDPHPGKIQFRDVLVKPFADGPQGEEGPCGRLVVRLGDEPTFERKEGREQQAEPWVHAAGEDAVARRSPSTVTHAGRYSRFSAAGLFAREGETGAEKGTAAHARFASVGWIDPSAPANETERELLAWGWQEAFVRPGGEAELWRERSYELFRNGTWETGQFDRVVFTGAGESRTAVVYDFKTNARRPDETETAFAERMRETYGPQMNAYREALEALTGLPSARIRTTLLLTATATALPIRG